MRQWQFATDAGLTRDAFEAPRQGCVSRRFPFRETTDATGASGGSRLPRQSRNGTDARLAPASSAAPGPARWDQRIEAFLADVPAFAGEDPDASGERVRVALSGRSRRMLRAVNAVASSVVGSRLAGRLKPATELFGNASSEWPHAESPADYCGAGSSVRLSAAAEFNVKLDRRHK